MGLSSSRLYEIEVWSNSGQRVADISNLAKNRRYSMTRNNAETLEFDVDLDALAAANIGEHPRNLFLPEQTNLRVKRAGQYLFGCQVVESPPTLGANARSIHVRADGYLNLLMERYITATYTATEATSIATGIISTVQAVPNGNMGITLDPSQYATGVLRDRTYARVVAKDQLQYLTNLQDGRFDFTFSPSKVFRTVQELGAVRGDLRLMYGNNIKTATVNQVLPSNHIIGLGSGFGDDQLVASDAASNDVPSQLANYMRERIAQFNSVVLQATLDQNTAADLAYRKDLRYVPQITITGRELPDAFLSVGDRLYLDLTSQKYTDNIQGWYRLERMEVALTDSDFESDITLYFDNQYLDPETGENV